MRRVETKLHKTNFIKTINNVVIPIQPNSGPFLNWTIEERGNKLLMILSKTLRPGDIYEKGKEGRNRFISVEDCVNFSMN